MRRRGDRWGCHRGLGEDYGDGMRPSAQKPAVQSIVAIGIQIEVDGISSAQHNAGVLLQRYGVWHLLIPGEEWDETSYPKVLDYCADCQDAHQCEDQAVGFRTNDCGRIMVERRPAK